MVNIIKSRDKRDILDVLRSKNIIDELTYNFISKNFSTNETRIQALEKKNIVSQEDLSKAAAEIFNLPFVHIQGKKLDFEVLNLIPFEICQKYKIVCLEKKGNAYQIAVARPYRLGGKKSGLLHNIEKERSVEFHLSASTEPDVDWALKIYENFLSERAEKNTQTNLPSARTDKVKISNLPRAKLDGRFDLLETIRKIPLEIIRRYKIALFEISDENIFKIAMLDSFDPRAREIINFISQKNGVKVEQYQIESRDLDWVLQNYNSAAAVQPSASKNIESEKLAPDQGAPDSSSSKEVIEKNGMFTIPEEAIAKPGLSGGEVDLAQADKTGAINQDEIETDLDTFLGKLVTNAKELTQIIVEGFVPKMVAGILSLGISLRASDVHLEATRKGLRLRYRVDGDLLDFIYMPIALHPPIISRIKILSGLKIDEQRIPQDGRYNAKVQNHEIDVRVSSYPTIHGEKIAMRLLDKTASQYSLEDLGLTGAPLEKINQEIIKPWGVVIITGPTGSGKSTTLYAILNAISSPKINIVTLEDPVEYDIPGVNQAQIKPKIGFSFAEGLRSILRQDPNVIMVGEVRDSETANLVTHAALTGHLVLTTLHTNDASSALPRLTNMKVEPYLITSAINVIIAQRLIRKLCQKCKQPIKVPAPVLESEGVKDVNEMKFFGPGKGCGECRNGYKGRIGIFEILVMTDAIEKLAINHAPVSEILKQAIQDGMVSLKEDGIAKAKQGMVSLSDILQAVNE
ncbi:MAG: type IV pilus assembly protein PilB [Candidatus Berkelbacteria bacterium Licking1014_7]|uniref:Type IV pilus assembly protein PilB n=1 Tax=Candidatus Berkelbacteria bacterium Licking1014_7 TaxID=2017147 RepID=A0A554LK14_9BACT|nr:MAG: type IV pilus assembly protein PilB [Candidatus Berkelbacteria bacterium Licking1014_7]